MMRTTHYHMHRPPHAAEAKEIWGVDFFWSKSLKIEDKELKKVTARVMHTNTDEKQSQKRNLD